MLAHTQSITICAHPDTVYAFVSDPHNLPRWASTFAPRIWPAEGDEWCVPSPAGEVRIRYETDSHRRTVDFHMRPLQPIPGVEELAASRVVPNGQDAEYVFTMFQFEGMADDVWRGQLDELPRELDRLKLAVEGS